MVKGPGRFGDRNVQSRSALTQEQHGRARWRITRTGQPMTIQSATRESLPRATTPKSHPAPSRPPNRKVMKATRCSDENRQSDRTPSIEPDRHLQAPTEGQGHRSEALCGVIDKGEIVRVGDPLVFPPSVVAGHDCSWS